MTGSAEDAPDAEDLTTVLRARGMRMTPQRERVLRALTALEHATPDAVADAVGSDGEPPLPLSTIYRNLEALERIGAVSHTHLDHRAPSYHLSTHADHLHLLCVDCGQVAQVPAALVRSLAGEVGAYAGFTVDTRHMVVQGWCRDCAGTRHDEADGRPDTGAPAGTEET